MYLWKGGNLHQPFTNQVATFPDSYRD